MVDVYVESLALAAKVCASRASRRDQRRLHATRPGASGIQVGGGSASVMRALTTAGGFQSRRVLASSVARRPQIAAMTSLIAMIASSTPAFQNVLGGELQRCSGSGMALTGFTRNGHCVDRDDDAGSHHVCIDMASNTGGNFCTVTGQPDWCSSTMSCDPEGSTQGTCPVQHWCVCEWAFTSYLERAGGCDKIQNIVCEATNMMALTHYREQASTPKVQAALSCLEQRCSPPK